MHVQRYTLEVLVDPQSDMDARDVGDVVDKALVTHLDGSEGVAYASLSPQGTLEEAGEGPLYVVVSMEYRGEFGTPHYVGLQVLHDLEENYATDLSLHSPEIVWCSRTRPTLN